MKIAARQLIAFAMVISIYLLFCSPSGLGQKAVGPLDEAYQLKKIAVEYVGRGRLKEAILIEERILNIRMSVFSADDPEIAKSLHDIAYLLTETGEEGKAEGLYQRALDIERSRLGPSSPIIGVTASNLAFVKLKLGKLSEAKSMFELALPVLRNGRHVIGLASALNNLAVMERDKAKARSYFEEAVRLFEKSNAIQTWNGLSALSSAGNFLAEQGDWRGARRYLERAVAGYIEVERVDANSFSDKAQLARINTVSVYKSMFGNLIDAIAEVDGFSDSSFDTTFELAQWASTSEASRSFSLLSARIIAPNSELSAIVRRRQDLTFEWRRQRQAELMELESVGKVSSESLQKSLKLGSELEKLTKRLRSDYIESVALSRPEPLSAPEVRSFLNDNEALILLTDIYSADGYVSLATWVITQKEKRWRRLKLKSDDFAELVDALRCGLDGDGAWGGGDTRCPTIFKGKYTREDIVLRRPLPFDAKRAHELYLQTFGQFEGLLRSKELIIVSSGRIADIPPHVLVSVKPAKNPEAFSDYRNIAWLARQHAITVLPSAASIKIRGKKRPSRASKPYLGIGNPLLEGSDPSYSQLKRAAAERTSCAAKGERLATRSDRGRTYRSRGVRSGMASGVADVGELRAASPLPETADELCFVARVLGALDEDVLLGMRATEKTLSNMNQAGKLGDYRVIHFATHGALAGEVAGINEPGLLLTPPVRGTQEDDGFLSASDVTLLKLNADWVILSACNTAVGAGDGSEGLSGLARAFFYAGARALLVSHWYVDSQATVLLVTRTIREMETEKVSRAEAFRRAMMSLVSEGEERHAHPAAWAPFVVVGADN